MTALLRARGRATLPLFALDQTTNFDFQRLESVPPESDRPEPVPTIGTDQNRPRCSYDGITTPNQNRLQVLRSRPEPPAPDQAKRLPVPRCSWIRSKAPRQVLWRHLTSSLAASDKFSGGIRQVRWRHPTNSLAASDNFDNGQPRTSRNSVERGTAWTKHQDMDLDYCCGPRLAS